MQKHTMQNTVWINVNSLTQIDFLQYNCHVHRHGYVAQGLVGDKIYNMAMKLLGQDRILTPQKKKKMYTQL